MQKKFVICDITGRTINYDEALCSSVQLLLNSNENLEFWSQGGNHSNSYKLKSFSSLVPSRFKNSSSLGVRILKAVDAIFAYLCILYRFSIHKPVVFHLQWLPFISLGTKGAFIDIFFLKLIKVLSKDTLWVYTIHNICPHGMKDNDRATYNPIFRRAMNLFDEYVVHTKQTKEEVCQVFNLPSTLVNVIYHGVFVPKDIVFARKPWDNHSINLLMYGSQNWYKGTDILVQSLKYIPENIKPFIHVMICGVIDKEMENACKIDDTSIDVKWENYFLSDNQLYDRIKDSDIIILPYRRISQSGVLLLALATKRLIITSNLPTFMETLNTLDPSLFFESENPLSLAKLITRYVNDTIDRNTVYNNLNLLLDKYSWEKSALKTIVLYRKTKNTIQ